MSENEDAQDRPYMRRDQDEASLFFNDEDSIENMYLTFGLDAEEYGIGIVNVTEIIGMQRIMEVPDVPGFIKGVINLRGKVIAIMDVRSRFAMAPKPYTQRTVIIVLSVDDIQIGLVVDKVSEVVEIAADQIDQPPQYGAHRDDTSVILGLGKQDDRVVILLDVKRLVSTQDLDLRHAVQGCHEPA